MTQASSGLDSQPTTCTTLYRWYDVDDVLLYVGITDDPGQRKHSHSQKSPWMAFAVRSERVTFPTRVAGAEAEERAIRAERPVFNRAHNDSPGARLRAVEYLLAHKREDLLEPMRITPRSSARQRDRRANDQGSTRRLVRRPGPATNRTGEVWAVRRGGHEHLVAVVGHNALTAARGGVLAVVIYDGRRPSLLEPAVALTDGTRVGVAIASRVGEVDQSYLTEQRGELSLESREALDIALRAALDL